MVEGAGEEAMASGCQQLQPKTQGKAEDSDGILVRASWVSWRIAKAWVWEQAG